MPLQFEPISLEKQQDFRAQLAACPQKSSDYSFINLWGWAEAYDLSWAWEDQLVWIKQTRPRIAYWAPIGPWEAIDWQAVFNRYTFEPGTFIRIPEQLVQCWEHIVLEQKRVSIQEARGQWDYLYDIQALVELKGNRFHKKKNLLNQFKKQYAYTYSPLSPDTAVKAIHMQSAWCTWRDCESSDILSSENQVIEKILSQWENLERIYGGLITIDDNIVAYTVAEQLTDDTLLIHFEKGNPDFKGSYQAINQMFLENSAEHFSIVNREQDLDEPSLRKAKLSYHPSGFLKKYQVFLL